MRAGIEKKRPSWPGYSSARHIFANGIEGRFYSQIRKYHHEGGKVYWSMAEAPEGATLINRCNEDQTYEARLAAGTLPQRQSRG